MTKKDRIARGEVVDFDVLVIKQKLASNPVPVSVDIRRKYIDEKDGMKARVSIPQTSSALATATSGAETSKRAAKRG